MRIKEVGLASKVLTGLVLSLGVYIAAYFACPTPDSWRTTVLSFQTGEQLRLSYYYLFYPIRYVDAGCTRPLERDFWFNEVSRLPGKADTILLDESPWSVGVRWTLPSHLKDSVAQLKHGDRVRAKWQVHPKTGYLDPVLRLISVEKLPETDAIREARSMHPRYRQSGT
jgi:hypothetical protein